MCGREVVIVVVRRRAGLVVVVVEGGRIVGVGVGVRFTRVWIFFRIRVRGGFKANARPRQRQVFPSVEEMRRRRLKGGDSPPPDWYDPWNEEASLLHYRVQRFPHIKAEPDDVSISAVTFPKSRSLNNSKAKARRRTRDMTYRENQGLFCFPLPLPLPAPTLAFPLPPPDDDEGERRDCSR